MTASSLILDMMEAQTVEELALSIFGLFEGSPVPLQLPLLEAGLYASWIGLGQLVPQVPGVGPPALLGFSQTSYSLLSWLEWSGVGCWKTRVGCEMLEVAPVNDVDELKLQETPAIFLYWG